VDHEGETLGSLVSEAIGLYRAFGYQDCSPFGDYKDDPLSLFMTKSLRPLTKIDSEF
jgi:hypothetical protein